MTVEVAKAARSDALQVCEVLRRSILEVCGPDYTQIDGFVENWLDNKTPETIAKWIEAPETYFVVARVSTEERIAGVGCVSRHGEILLCYAVPEYIGKGIGRAMLASLEQQAKNWGNTEFTVLSTVTARTFYARQGYVETGLPVKEHGIEIEILMVKNNVLSPIRTP